MATNNLIKAVVQRDGTVEYVPFTPEEVAAYEEASLRHQEALQKREQAQQRRERIKQLRNAARDVDLGAIDLDRQSPVIRQLVEVMRWLKDEVNELVGEDVNSGPI